MISAFGVGRVLRINSGEKNGNAWTIAAVAYQDYVGKDESGKAKYADIYASLMIRGKTATKFASAVSQGKVIQFMGKPRAGKPYSKEGKDPVSSLEIEIDDFNGYWRFCPFETNSNKETSITPAVATSPLPPDDPEDPDPFAGIKPV